MTMIIKILITLIIISFILICAIHPFIWFVVNQQLRLVPGSKFYANWLKPSIPIRIQFYFFNLTNPKQFQHGARPILKQLGPYTYREQRFKFNVQHCPTNGGSIEYQEIKQYYFDRDLSIGNEMDTVTNINLGFIGIAAKLTNLPFTINWLIELFEKQHGYLLFQTKTIKQLLWGYQDEFLTLLSDYGIQVPMKEIGLLIHRNNTPSERILIDDGLKNAAENFGRILKFNNQTSLNYWTTLTANMINGTDGTLYQKFLNKAHKPYVFAYDLCRSIQLNWYSTSELYNLSVYKYILSENTFKSTENKGFCLNWSDCFKDGVLDMSSCQSNAPVVVSQPHFINADKSYQNAVEGIQPNNEEFNTTIYIEPITGLIIKAHSKFQVNIVIRNNPKIQQLSQISNVLLPLVYFNESAQLNQTLIHQLQMVLIQIPTIIQSILLVIIVFNVLVLCSMMFKSFLQNRRDLNLQRINEEKQPLLKKESRRN
ncbi:unnamed protein product [Schistosoma turkestanicum]|nr:unnamed protein product [Schistosoma turkestanicum]